MALVRIDQSQKIVKNTNRVHDEVSASYTTFVDGGKRYFQIGTYGRPERTFAGKTSQSIQFDEESAEALVKVLKAERMLGEDTDIPRSE